ncbi:MAG: heme exporter protein CcmD [Candidatus Rokubacteria bacterium]|nr:heme exporter protein CcmD [Candidatus Rokubacteria bacterium]MBI2879066.1 heme exporter protein CcmD [Candidatus Rokubacteria bacterium]
MDHWGFILAAYGIAALLLGGYWWRAERRIREAERALREERSR